MDNEGLRVRDKINKEISEREKKRSEFLKSMLCDGFFIPKVQLVFWREAASKISNRRLRQDELSIEDLGPYLSDGSFVSDPDKVTRVVLVNAIGVSDIENLFLEFRKLRIEKGFVLADSH